LGLIWQPTLSAAPLSLRASAGWSLTSLNVRGEAAATFVGLSLEHTTWGPWLGAGVRWRVAPHVSLVGELSAALALPSETIRLAGRPVADFARPALSVGLGPELTWP
jgi:hypothetical protein